jgi:hypothetical protein
MKKIITIALLLIAFTAANAQTNSNADTDKKSAQSSKAADTKETKSPAVKDPKASFDDQASEMIGTSDFYMKMNRDAVKKG